MSNESGDADVKAIRALIARQFGNLQWSPEEPADWAGFTGDFLPGATLFPSARPVKPQSVPAFVERMKGLAAGALQKFDEAMLGANVHVFGNVAVALAACELRENDGAPQRQVEVLLLVKDGGTWRIAAQAWDAEKSGRHIPKQLLDEA